MDRETRVDTQLPPAGYHLRTWRAAGSADRAALDVGCGLGFFSERLVQRGATVTACDIGPNLVEQTRVRAGCQAVVADALQLAETFGHDRFDLVLSSECIEERGPMMASNISVPGAESDATSSARESR